MLRALYRFQQGLRALVAWTQPVDFTVVARHLTPDLLVLYRRMRRSEQQHSLRVLRDLLAAGQTHPDLLTAALLHDVGKTRFPFSIPEKVVVVLVKAARPDLYARWGHSSPHSWRRPFAVSVQHPAWGADMAAAAGAMPLTVELIRRHADPMPDAPATTVDQLLSILQSVDDRN